LRRVRGKCFGYRLKTDRRGSPVIGRGGLRKGGTWGPAHLGRKAQRGKKRPGRDFRRKILGKRGGGKNATLREWKLSNQRRGGDRPASDETCHGKKDNHRLEKKKPEVSTIDWDERASNIVGKCTTAVKRKSYRRK